MCSLMIIKSSELLNDEVANKFYNMEVFCFSNLNGLVNYLESFELSQVDLTSSIWNLAGSIESGVSLQTVQLFTSHGQLKSAHKTESKVSKSRLDQQEITPLTVGCDLTHGQSFAIFSE